MSHRAIRISESVVARSGIFISKRMSSFLSGVTDGKRIPVEERCRLFGCEDSTSDMPPTPAFQNCGMSKCVVTGSRSGLPPSKAVTIRCLKVIHVIYPFPQQPKSPIRSKTASHTARRTTIPRSASPPKPRTWCGLGCSVASACRSASMHRRLT